MNQSRNNPRNRRPVDPLLEQFPANNAIRSPQVRLIGADGSNLGVVDTRTALWQARNSELDLVCISADAQPPVAKILDYGRFLYDHKRAAKLAARKSRESQIIIKEIQLRPVTDQHDIATKLGHAREWLEDQHTKIKVVIKFRGREMSFRERGFVVMRSFIDGLAGCKIEREPSMSGNQITAMLAPGKLRKIDSANQENA
jgi:translation initiation factor IF-3